MTVPLNPDGAAFHAVVVQGGFSTPAIEAFRILDDALRLSKQGALDEEWKEGVDVTLKWIGENAGPEVERERMAWLRRHETESYDELAECLRKAAE